MRAHVGSFNAIYHIRDACEKCSSLTERHQVVWSKCLPSLFILLCFICCKNVFQPLTAFSAQWQTRCFNRPWSTFTVNAPWCWKWGRGAQLNAHHFITRVWKTSRIQPPLIRCWHPRKHRHTWRYYWIRPDVFAAVLSAPTGWDKNVTLCQTIVTLCFRESLGV